MHTHMNGITVIRLDPVQSQRRLVMTVQMTSNRRLATILAPRRSPPPSPPRQLQSDCSDILATAV